MFDCIIVGTGPAGLSAAINLKTYNKDFVWFGSKTLSDKVVKAEKVVNYPGFPEISGSELAAKFQGHIESAGLEITEKSVTNIMDAGDYFMVLADNEIYEAKTLILAMGVMNAKLLDGEEEYLGRGVSYCATCDGGLYKGRKIAVFCNTKKYEHEVDYLSDLASEVLYFPTFDTDFAKENVTVSKDFPIAVEGDKVVRSITLRFGETVEVSALFCLRNAIAPTALMPGLAVENGHIAVDRKMETNMKGCFACGDCTGRPYQYTKAVGEGNVAAHSVIEYLAELKKEASELNTSKSGAISFE